MAQQKDLINQVKQVSTSIDQLLMDWASLSGGVASKEFGAARKLLGLAVAKLVESVPGMSGAASPTETGASFPGGGLSTPRP